MSMREQFGEQPTEAPEGMLRPLSIKLAPMDEWTSDGRRLQSSGRGLRPLPFSLFAQFKNSGHWEAELVGTVNEVVFADGWATGKGWIFDDENGRKLVAYRKAGAMSRNSVDLADTKVEWILEQTGEDDFGPIYEIKYNFVEWKIGATTLLAPIPAFADASWSLDTSDEVMASLAEDRSELVLDDLVTEIPLESVAVHEEIVASAGSLPPWDAFHQPEAATPHKVTVHGDLTVTGHVALWDTCHAGIDNSCVIPPKPKDGYAGFCQPGVLTDQGMVNTGPIFLAGGHKTAANGDYADAYGGIENTWCDVRVVPGKFGPWVSGIVRPGTPEEKIYAARASRVSGHWKKGDLKAIVSVNAEGYRVAGELPEITAGFFSITDGEVDELVASFPDCMGDRSEPEPQGDEVPESLGADMVTQALEDDVQAAIDEAELALAEAALD